MNVSLISFECNGTENDRVIINTQKKLAYWIIGFIELFLVVEKRKQTKKMSLQKNTFQKMRMKIFYLIFHTKYLIKQHF